MSSESIVVELNSNWVCLRLSQWKPHVVSSRLVTDLMEDGAKRMSEFFSVEPAPESVFIDLPGMIMVDRTHVSFEVDGLNVEMPTQDAEHFYNKLLMNDVRTFPSGTQYYKIHGWLVCLVLTVEQRDALFAMIHAQLDEIRAKTVTEETEMRRRLAKIQKSAKLIKP